MAEGQPGYGCGDGGDVICVALLRMADGVAGVEEKKQDEGESVEAGRGGEASVQNRLSTKTWMNLYRLA